MKEKKYENPGKYYPGSIVELSVGSRFLTSENNFYNGRQGGGIQNNFYTTSQNFPIKKQYDSQNQQ